MNPILAIAPVDASSLPLIKELLQKEDLPTQDLQVEMDLFYAQKDSQIISCGGFERSGKIGLLRSVAISPHNQGKGLGKIWMQQLFEKAQELGIEELYLLTTTAEGFFTKIGFATISREHVPQAIQESQEFSSLCPSSAVLMYRKI